MTQDELISTTSVSPRRRRESFRSVRRSIAIKRYRTLSATQPLMIRLRLLPRFIKSPIRKDYTELIKSTVECIRTLDFRMLRAQKDFQEAIKCPGVDPEFIQAQAYRFRLITATLGNRMNELITLLGEGHEVEKV